MFASPRTLSVAVAHQWATAEPIARRSAGQTGGIVDATVAFLAICESTESVSGVDPDEAWEPTPYPSVRDCWMAGVTATIMWTQGPRHWPQCMS